MKIKVKKFDDGDRLLLDVDDVPLGQGAQGDVLKVRSIEGKPVPRELIKIYRPSISGMPRNALREHLRVFVDRVSRPVSFSARSGAVKNSLWNYPGLGGLPRSGFDLDDGRFGFFMTYISGDTIEVTDGAYEQLVNRNLATKIQVCRDVSTSVYYLHDSGIIHCDIADDNTIISVNNKSNIFIIDADGGSILHPSGKSEPVPGGSALVRGKLAYMAPEIETGGHPSYDSDNWSLGILLHKVLLGYDLMPYETMGWSGSGAMQSRFEWPPDPTKVPDLFKPSAEHQNRELRLRLGYSLLDKFQSTFSYDAGVRNPTMRTKSLTWANLFEKSLKWINKCISCGQEFVSWSRTACPFCNKSIPCATLTIAGKKFVLSEDLEIGDQDIRLSKKKTKTIIKLTRKGAPESWDVNFDYDGLQSLDTQKHFAKGSNVVLTPGKNRFALIGNGERLEFTITL